jgi:uncharacterized protein YbjT (DUF2867 family)
MVIGSHAMIMGNLLTPWHWIAAEDYVAMVSKAFVTPKAAGKTFFIYGSEALTFKEALHMYVTVCAPTAKISKMPFWLLWLMLWLPRGGAMLRNVGLPIMLYFSKVAKEIGAATEANAILGAPTTTVNAWSELHRSHSKAKN